MALRRLAALAGCATLLSFGATALPAAADPVCPGGKVCFYSGGSLTAIRDAVAINFCSVSQQPWDRVWNRSTFGQWSYSSSDCSWGGRWIPAGSQQERLGPQYSFGG